MKGSLVAAAAALIGSASAGRIHHRHAAAHELFEKRGDSGNELCTTIYETIYGEITWRPTPECTDSTTHVTKTQAVTTTVTETPCTVPTLAVETCKVPGTYTFPATTVVVTETTTVCGGSTTSVPAGTHTLGGVTTVVETATTVVCPVATTSTLPGGVVTSVIDVTTYVCPSAGTYTIAPITTVCATETIVVVPVVTTFCPATYTRPAVITTVTETDVVVYCPFEVPSPTPTPAPAPPPAVKTVTTHAAAPAPPATTKAAAPPPPPPAPPAPKKAAPKKVTPAPAAGSLGGGSQWAITYTPYTTTGQCKSSGEVLADITEIKQKGFTTVRVYSTDCDTLPNVGAACGQVGIKMIIGVFIGEVGCDNSNPDVASQIAAIQAWGQWDLVELVVVGNEAGNDGFCTPGQLKELIVEVKQIIVEAGCNVPVTTTDTVNVWQNPDFSGVLCEVVDVVACNAHAYFNAQTPPSQAGDFVSGQLEIVKNICGKEGYVMETGWPSQCEPNGIATCSPSDQATAIASLKSALGGSVVFFSYSNDDWKDNGSCGCEQHWGCGDLF
ncbi:cell wall glucanase [Niveomyces insectorum RCEF 264]|uniref:Probable beta-glucosidase btgE n=1 Tax=Niveomyces insectorum RCEF 264 TaxID=1081102 RepID=A0A167X279_9HYPO|nr:cell wall glucanase [Niveomyces insectorum RCEF 264]